MDRKILYLFYSFNPTSVAILHKPFCCTLLPHQAVDCGPFQPFHVHPPLRTMLWTMDRRPWSVGGVPPSTN